jgi:hypothetical protein
VNLLRVETALPARFKGPLTGGNIRVVSDRVAGNRLILCSEAAVPLELPNLTVPV